MNVSRSPLRIGDVLPLTLDIPTSRRCLYTIDLVLGDIDNDDVIEFFTCSKCHLFACGLHEETGYGFTVLRLKNNYDAWHAGVTVGDEFFVDITGPKPVEDAIKSFSNNNGDEPVGIEFYENDIQAFYKAINPGNPVSDDWWSNDGGFTFDTEFGGLVIGDVVRPFVSEFLNRYRWI
jgi:hypothetical protein